MPLSSRHGRPSHRNGIVLEEAKRDRDRKLFWRYKTQYELPSLPPVWSSKRENRKVSLKDSIKLPE
jgi:hypothetical protein